MLICSFGFFHSCWINLQYRHWYCLMVRSLANSVFNFCQRQIAWCRCFTLKLLLGIENCYYIFEIIGLFFVGRRGLPPLCVISPGIFGLGAHSRMGGAVSACLRVTIFGYPVFSNTHSFLWVRPDGSLWRSGSAVVVLGVCTVIASPWPAMH